MILVRPLVYLAAAGLLAWVFSWPAGEFGAGLDRTLWFGLFATVSLWLAMLPGPLYAVAPELPGRRAFIHARRALGVSSMVFAALHGWAGLGWLGGFEGLQWWSWDYNLALALGFIAWLMLLALAATSFDVAVAKLGKRWGQLHRLVYPAAVLVVAHAAIITIHVLNLEPWLTGWFVAVLLLLFLELLRFRQKATPTQDKAAFVAFFVSAAGLYWSTFLIGHHRH